MSDLIDFETKRKEESIMNNIIKLKEYNAPVIKFRNYN